MDNGNFLVAVSPEDGSEFSSKIKFKVNVDIIGKYRIEFATFMFCDNSNCSKASDHITIVARFGKQNKKQNEIIVADLNLSQNSEKGWNKNSDLINIQNEESKNFMVWFF